MAVLNANQLTLLDVVKRTAPDGHIDNKFAELLNQQNPMLNDMVLVKANEKTSHQVVIRTGLPPAYYRSINAGVPSGKSTTVQVRESMAAFEQRCTVDTKQLALSDDAAALMMSESVAFIESMNQAVADMLFYGNPAVDQRQALGLATRYGSLSGGNAQNILDAGGTGTDNTSIYLVNWGPETVFCPYPPGTSAGLQQKMLGEQRVLDANGNAYQAMEALYQWDIGMVVKDWRHAARICNIDVSNLISETAAADLIKLMTRLIFRIPSMGMGNPAFYMNRTVMSMMAIQAMNKSQNAIAVQPALNQLGQIVPGKFEYTFLGVPMRLSDRLLNTEARVV